jgi:phage gp29-like protein
MDNTTPTQTLIQSEIIQANYDIMYKYGVSASENFDSVVRRKGMDYLLEDVIRDPHVNSTLQTRYKKLLKRGYKIKPANTSPDALYKRNFVDYVFDNMAGSFSNDIVAMLTGIAFGFSISEKIFTRYENGPYIGKIGYQAIRWKSPKNFAFHFDHYGNYKINQVDPVDGPKDIPRSKVFHFIHGFDDENPYGRPSLSNVAFWVWLKKNAAKFWAIFAERFGIPLAILEVPDKMNDLERRKAEEVLAAAAKDSGIQLPKNFKLDFLEAKRSGSAYYNDLVERCNKEISKEILGQTLSNEEGTRGQGSYALGSAHMVTLDDWVMFEANTIADLINNDGVKQLIRINFGANATNIPVFEWNIDSVAVLTAIADVLTKIPEGVQIPSKWFYQHTGIPRPEPDDDILQLATSTNAQQPGASGPDNRIRSGLSRVSFAENDANFQKQIDAVFDKYQKNGVNYFSRLKAAIKKKTLI